MVYRVWNKSNDLLPKWFHAIEEFNPSWINFISTSASLSTYVVFDHVFKAFAPSIGSFKYYQPVISINAIFLYGKYWKKIKIITIMDMNNQIFSLVFNIVDEGSTNTWD